MCVFNSIKFIKKKNKLGLKTKKKKVSTNPNQMKLISIKNINELNQYIGEVE